MTIVVDQAAIQDIVLTVSGTISGLSALIVLPILVPLTFYVSRRIVSLFPRRH